MIVFFFIFNFILLKKKGEIILLQKEIPSQINNLIAVFAKKQSNFKFLF